MDHARVRLGHAPSRQLSTNRRQRSRGISGRSGAKMGALVLEAFFGNPETSKAVDDNARAVSSHRKRCPHHSNK